MTADDEQPIDDDAPTPEELAEDEEFADDGVDEASARERITPIGEVTLPSGVTYKPRSIAGHEDLAWLRRCRDRQEHVLFYGPPGTGKTALSEAAFFPDAERADPEDPESPWAHHGLESIVCTVDTTEADFLGTFVQDPNTGRFVWAPGPLQRAVEGNRPLYCDELFIADPRILSSTLYPLMDGRGVLRIPANPTLPPIPVRDGFFVVGSGNPDVPGAVFSEALRDRFDHHVEVNTDWKLARELDVPAAAVQVAKHLDLMLRRKEISWSPQLRALLSYRDAVKAFGQEYAVQAMIGKAPFQDRDSIREVVLAKFGIGTPLALEGRYEQ